MINADNPDSLSAALLELEETLRRKNASYGNAFEDDLNEFGMTALAIQAGHKLKRIKAMLAGNNSIGSESMEDAVKDLAGYAILAYAWTKEKEHGME